MTVTGFDMDNQRIAKAQVQATLQLVKAIQNLTEMLERELHLR